MQYQTTVFVSTAAKLLEFIAPIVSSFDPGMNHILQKCWCNLHTKSGGDCSCGGRLDLHYIFISVASMYQEVVRVVIKFLTSPVR
jgi:hypothetical protein